MTRPQAELKGGGVGYNAERERDSYFRCRDGDGGCLDGGEGSQE